VNCPFYFKIGACRNGHWDEFGWRVHGHGWWWPI
jgi:hypothetical protein